MPGFFTRPDGDEVEGDAISNAFDWIQLKHAGDTVSCPVCAQNVWGYGGRVGVTQESEDFHPRRQRTLVQIVCKNCEYVMLFSERILKGPLADS